MNGGRIRTQLRPVSAFLPFDPFIFQLALFCAKKILPFDSFIFNLTTFSGPILLEFSMPSPTVRMPFEVECCWICFTAALLKFAAFKLSATPLTVAAMDFSRRPFDQMNGLSSSRTFPNAAAWTFAICSTSCTRVPTRRISSQIALAEATLAARQTFASSNGKFPT